MTKEPTRTIYSCLDSSFWTKRKCSKCQVRFTSADYHAQNYQLTFLKLLKVDQLNLTVNIQLSHQSCCAACTNYLQDLKKCSIPISKK